MCNNKNSHSAELSFSQRRGFIISLALLAVLALVVIAGCTRPASGDVAAERGPQTQTSQQVTGTPTPPLKPSLAGAAASETNSASGMYEIGSPGPAGGIVFFDHGADRDGFRYLEIATELATAEPPGVFQWAEMAFTRATTTGAMIGEGYQNTAHLLSSVGGMEYAIPYAAALEINGFRDWFVPSIDELRATMSVLDSLPLLLGAPIWTSTYNELQEIDAYLPEENQWTSLPHYESAQLVVIRAFRSDGTPAFAPLHAAARPAGSTPVEPARDSSLIGTVGPAGGVIVFDQGNASADWRYLEAAPADLVINGRTTFSWGPTDRAVLDEVASLALGAGLDNTQRIIAAIPGEPSAARFAAQYSTGGFTDWFLPSGPELEQVYAHRHHVPGLAAARYWSSSESGAREAMFTDFGDRSGYAVYDPFVNKDEELRIRTVRRF